MRAFYRAAWAGAGFKNNKGIKPMSWLGIILVVLGVVLAIKITAFVLRLVFIGIILVGLYLFLGPLLGFG